MTRGVLAAWLTLALQVATIGCSDLSSRSGTQVTPEAGSLYSVNDGEGWFRIAKVLAVDEKGVHIRLYKNRFKGHPRLGTASGTDVVPTFNSVLTELPIR